MSVRDSNQKLLEDIEFLETKLTSITASYDNGIKVENSDPDYKTLDILSELEIKKENYKDNAKLISDVEYALLGLDEMEKDIVLTLYGSSIKDKRDIKRLEKEYCYTQRQMYRKAQEYLVHISLRMLGDY